MARRLAFGPAPALDAPLDIKLQYIFNALREIEIGANDHTSQETSDAYQITNLTEDRVLDCDSTTLGEVADVLGTLINDFNKRGQKRSI